MNKSCFPSYWHFHPEMELTYIEHGTGIRYIGDSIETFHSGDLVLIGENLPHDYVSTTQNETDHSVAYVFQFPSTVIQHIVECRSLYQLFSEANLGIQFIAPSSRLVEKIKATSSNPSLNNFINFLAILNDLQKEEKRRSISSIAFTNNKVRLESQNNISKVIRYISEYFHQPISINQMAQLINMTPPSFCRWFKQSIGTSFVTYLNATRIEKACQLLLQTSSPIAHIGFETGFETISHFNRTFKKIKKMTPREYRKMLLDR